jgi:hypothetical protein
MLWQNDGCRSMGSKQPLSSFLATLNILSLLFHTLLELLDQKYKLLRAHLPTRKTFFDDLRALTRYMTCISIVRIIYSPSCLNV